MTYRVTPVFDTLCEREGVSGYGAPYPSFEKRHLALCGIHVCLWAYVSAK
ncbi:MAG: hypothetical protein O8C62_08305 [Candidatus Methanoperedens sp.]|nr:hypothetical protein [Candidatus Methanoperedens sp.]